MYYGKRYSKVNQILLRITSKNSCCISTAQVSKNIETSAQLGDITDLLKINAATECVAYFWTDELPSKLVKCKNEKQ